MEGNFPEKIIEKSPHIDFYYMPAHAKSTLSGFSIT